MGVHWSEFPERVETFGELLSVLETLDRHDMEHGFTAEWFDKERKRLTAYQVEHTDYGWQLFPNLDQMPGLERLLDHFAINGYPTLAQRAARELRLRAARTLNRDAAALNAMTFTAIMDALKPAPLPSPAIRTFGDFLANVRAIEQAAALTRASVTVGEPGSGYWLGQAAFFESEAAFRKHPLFPHLEAHVNREYGEFTSANLLRLRGEVCALCRCGTREVDELPVETVAALLNCPGTEVNADMPKPTEQRVDTTPQRMKPLEALLAAALHALPGVLNNAPPPQGVCDKQKRRGADYAILRQRLEGDGHKLDAVEWAIHAHVEAGRLEAAPGLTSTPGVYRDGDWAMKPVTNRTYDRERCILWANESLWAWWENEQNPKPAPELEPTEYTMADIRALLVYEREIAKFEERQRAFDTNTSVAALHNRALVAALNAPISPRLTLDRAFGIAVFRQLSLQSENIFRRPLDERGLLHFVGEVANLQQQPLEAMWDRTVGEFEQLFKSKGGPGGNKFDRHTDAPDGDAAELAQPSRFAFRRERGMVEIHGAGQSARLDGALKGTTILEQLLRRAGTTVPWADLDPAIARDGKRSEQPALDSQALAQLRRERDRLQEEVDTADNEIDANDSQQRLTEIKEQLASATGLRGKPRDLNSLVGKLRPKIWGSLNTVFEKLRSVPHSANALAEHLQAHISSSADGFVYDPPLPALAWDFEGPKK